MNSSSLKESSSKNKTNVLEVAFWFLSWVLLAIGVLFAGTTTKKLVVASSLIVSLMLPLIKLIFKNSKFIKGINSHLQTCISLTAVLGAGAGFGFDVFQRFEYYGILLHFYGGIVGVAIGYYIIMAIREIKSAKDCNFTTLTAFSISCAFLVPRKILQFFIDYFTGRNLIKCDFVGEDHWLYSVVGHMNSMYEQSPLYDYSEDLLFGLVGTVIATGVLYLYLRAKNKELLKKEKRVTSFSVKDIPSRCVDKLFYEIEKVKQQTNIWDMIIWWCTRALMFYAFVTMENRAEATLLLVIFIGTFAISILHFITPKTSMFCRIDYKVQTLVTVIAFFGSYIGNYINIYSVIGRYDSFLHFISGFIAFAAGYYLALTLIKPENQKDRFAICVFAFAFAIAIIPIHETVEFVGDYIWGTTNQGFMWEPDDRILLYRFFGHGVGNELLIRIYDTIYDMSLASSTTTLSFIASVVYIIAVKKDKKDKNVEVTHEKEKVSC